jgi:hypothetical protein
MATATPASVIRPRLISEHEIVSDYGFFNNGAGPFWGFGSRLLVREGTTLFAVLPELDPAAKPLCNTRWTLWQYPDGGAWSKVASGQVNEREPCLLVRLPGQRLLLSTNPAQRVRSLMEDGRQACDCQPELLLFDAAQPNLPPQVSTPPWTQPWKFSEHSYRALAVEPTTGTAMLAHQIYNPAVKDYGHAWGLRTADGQWTMQSPLHFPMRGCYQQVALRGGAVHIMAISDEDEPVTAWREFKQKVTGQKWDYEFRQLFYTWTPDLATRPLSPPLTVDSRDATCGMIRNLDLWLDAAGDAWVLYLDRNVWHAYMRQQFWPKLPLTVSLRLAKLHHGRVVERRTLAEARETPGAGDPWRGPEVTWAQFHAQPGDRLWVIWHQKGSRPGNYAMPILPNAGKAMRLPLRQPMQQFQTLSERAGCLPSEHLDLIGTPATGRALRHARLSLPG